MKNTYKFDRRVKTDILVCYSIFSEFFCFISPSKKKPGVGVGVGFGIA